MTQYSVSRCRFTQQVYFSIYNHVTHWSARCSFPQTVTHQHTRSGCLFALRLMDTKTVNYPKRAHEERHGRLVALHIHSETPDSPHLQLFPTRHKPGYLQGALGGSKAQSAIESHSHPTTCFVLLEKCKTFKTCNRLNAFIWQISIWHTNVKNLSQLLL